MKIVKIKGGLGNQLFQYAFARYFSIQKKAEVKIDNGVNTHKEDTYRQYELGNFNTTLALATKEEVIEAKYPHDFISKLTRAIEVKILKIHHIGYSPNILDTEENYLDGYWQSHKYLNPIRDVLLKEITLKKPLPEKYKNILDQIKNTPSVSIHIRRGDYVNNKKTKSMHDICTLEYYSKAIDLIQASVNNPTFFIFSDDIDWVSKNLAVPHPAFWVSNLDGKGYEEMHLMSLCRHNIIANSSFSFWGAWLNQNPNKIVVAPRKWNNRYQDEYKDLLPSNWLKV
jgi:hypothetical protein